MKCYRFLFAALVAAIFLSGCSPAPSAPEPTPRPRPLDVTIEMSEYAFNPSEIEAKVGQEVTLTLVNVGQMDHELMIGRDVDMHDGVPVGYQVDLFRSAGIIPTVQGDGMLMAHAEGDHQQEAGTDAAAGDLTTDLQGDGDLMVVVPVGAGPTTETFTVTDEMVGEWEMGCFQLDGVHYNAGMVGKFTVTN